MLNEHPEIYEYINGLGDYYRTSVKTVSYTHLDVYKRQRLQLRIGTD